MTGRRLALLFAIDQYDDDRLSRLQAPIGDAEALAEVLGDRSLGGFDVDVVTNPTSLEAAERLDALLADRHPRDAVLVHFACHGLKDDSGDLYLAATNTTPRRLFSTGIPTSLLMRMIRRSPAESVVLLLDCCYGGAFDRVLPRGDDIDLAPQMREAGLPDGRGVAVISASSATEWAYEVPGLGYTKAPATSVFTRALVEGIRSGDADRDRDGNISVNELYEYVEERVRAERPKQTPRKWEFDMRGGALLIARSQRRVLAATGLPPEVHEATFASLTGTRLGAVHELTVLTEGNSLPLAAAARAALEMLTDDDSRKVSQAAAEAVARTEIRLSATKLDIGLVPCPSAVPTPPVTAKIIGVPVALASSVTASQGIQAWLDGDQLMVTGNPDRPGPIEGVVTVTGPAGEASVEVTGWVAADPRPFLQEAVRLAGTIVGDPFSEIGIVAVAALLAAWSGNKDQAAQWLSGTTGLARVVADPIKRAAAEAVCAWALGESSDSEGAADALARARAAVAAAAEDEAAAGPAEEPTVALATVPIAPQGAEEPTLELATVPVVPQAPEDSQDLAESAEDDQDGQGSRVLVELLVEWVAARLASEGDDAPLIEAIADVIDNWLSNDGALSACLAALAWTAYCASAGGRPTPHVDTLLNEATDLARGVEEALDRGFSLAAVAWSWCQVGEFGHALELVGEVEHAATSVKKPDDGGILLLLGAIVGVQAGDVQRGRRLLSQAPSVDVVNDAGDDEAALELLICAWAAAQIDDSERVRTALDDAVTILRAIQKPADRLSMVGAAAFCAFLVKDHTRMTALIDEALEFSVSVDNAGSRALGLFLPAWLTAQHGGPPAAVHAASAGAAVQREDPIPADEPIGMLTMLALTWAAGWTGAREQAAELLAELERLRAEIPDDGWRALFTAALAWVSTQVGDRDRGLRLASELAAIATESDDDDAMGSALRAESVAAIYQFCEGRPYDEVLRTLGVLLPAGQVARPLAILTEAWITLFRRLVLGR